MSLVTVEGRYKAGRIDLTEAPAGVEEARVLVTFLPVSASPQQGKRIYFGMFKGDRMTTEEDFKLAEWRGDWEGPSAE